MEEESSTPSPAAQHAKSSLSASPSPPSPTSSSSPHKSSANSEPYSEGRGRTLSFSAAEHQACRERINAAGEKILKKALKQKRWPLVSDLPESERICPASGAAYEMYFFGQEVVLFCPGHDYKGLHSMRWLVRRKWVDKLNADGWEDDLALAVLQRNRNHPREALDLGLRSYALKKTSSALLIALISAVDLDDRLDIERVADFAQALPGDLLAQVSRAHCLGYLGRYSESEKICAKLDKINPAFAIVTSRIRGIINLAKGQGDKAIVQFNKTGRDFSWADIWVYFANRDFAKTLSAAQAALKREGFSADSAIDWVRLATLSGMALGGDQEEEGQALLAEGLRKCRRTWPYPLLLYLNREISEEELHRKAPDYPEEQVRVEVTVGADKILHDKKEEGQADLARVRQTWSLETYLARAWAH